MWHSDMIIKHPGFLLALAHHCPRTVGTPYFVYAPELQAHAPKCGDKLIFYIIKTFSKRGFSAIGACAKKRYNTVCDMTIGVRSVLVDNVDLCYYSAILRPDMGSFGISQSDEMQVYEWTPCEARCYSARVFLIWFKRILIISKQVKNLHKWTSVRRWQMGYLQWMVNTQSDKLTKN